MFLLNMIFSISSFAGDLFRYKAFTALVFLSIICLLVKLGLRRLRYKESELKSAGLNHRQRRKWRAMERHESKRGKRTKKRTVYRY